MLYSHAQIRFEHFSKYELVNRAKEDLIAFAFLQSEEVILTDWHKFAFNGFSTIGGQALELVVSGSENFNGAVENTLKQFYTQPIENKTDRVRLFYPALSFAFAELKRRNSDVGKVQMALRELNNDISKPLDEILNPDWVDPYTFEIDEFEFTNTKPNDVRKKYTISIGRKLNCIRPHRKIKDIEKKFRIALYRAFEEPIEIVPTDKVFIPMMEFDDEEFTEDEEDLGLAGDGLHPVTPFHYADMQADYMLTGQDRKGIFTRAVNFLSYITMFNSIYDAEFFVKFRKEIETYEEPHHKYAFFVFVEGLLPDGFVPDRFTRSVIVNLSTSKMSLQTFHDIFGDEILESIVRDETPYWTEMEMSEIDQFTEETINLQAIEYCALPEKKDVSKSYHYLQGYLRSCINGSTPKEWDNAGWSNYRMHISPEGHAAFQQAIANGNTFREAMKSFWMAYNNTIIAYSSKGLSLRSEKIDWRRAFYKAQAKEIPQSQIKKLFGVVSRVLQSNPNDYWLRKLAGLNS